MAEETLPPVTSRTTDAIIRSTDYSISELEMTLAIASIPPARRNSWWLLALAAPVAASATREAIRTHFLPQAKRTAFALIAPAVVGLAGAGILLMGRYGGLRPRRRCPAR